MPIRADELSSIEIVNLAANPVCMFRLPRTESESTESLKRSIKEKLGIPDDLQSIQVDGSDGQPVDDVPFFMIEPGIRLFLRLAVVDRAYLFLVSMDENEDPLRGDLVFYDSGDTSSKIWDMIAESLNIGHGRIRLFLKGFPNISIQHDPRNHQTLAFYRNQARILPSCENWSGPWGFPAAHSLRMPWVLCLLKGRWRHADHLCDPTDL